MDKVLYKTKLLTRYINRFFRRDMRINDWSYTFNHDSIDLQVDYVQDYEGREQHQTKRLSLCELETIPEKDIQIFSIYFVKEFSRTYENEIIYKE